MKGVRRDNEGGVIAGGRNCLVIVDDVRAYLAAALTTFVCRVVVRGENNVRRLRASYQVLNGL